MKANELRDKSVDELNQQLLSLREEQFKLRMAKATGQLGQSHLLKQTKRDIARVKTVLALLLALRCCTSRLALIRVSDSFSAASWSSAAKAEAAGSRAMARARRDSFIDKSSKSRMTFEKGRDRRRRTPDGDALRNTSRIRPGRSPGSRHRSARLPGNPSGR